MTPGGPFALDDSVRFCIFCEFHPFFKLTDGAKFDDSTAFVLNEISQNEPTMCMNSPQFTIPLRMSNKGTYKVSSEKF